MTTTLVTQRRARAGQATALVAAGLRLLGQGDAWNPARLRLRLFQGRHQPELLLMVSDWTSREAVRPQLLSSLIRSELDELTLGDVEYGFYHELTNYEPLLAPVALVTCSRLTCSRAALTRFLSYMLDVVVPTLRAQPGLVLHTLYQNEDRPNHFLTIRGYASVESYEAVMRTVFAKLDTGLREHGARVTYFDGQPVADFALPATGRESASDIASPAPRDGG
jgi:quinol monooxygenase YgiN